MKCGVYIEALSNKMNGFDDSERLILSVLIMHARVAARTALKDGKTLLVRYRDTKSDCLKRMFLVKIPSWYVHLVSDKHVSFCFPL